MPARADRSAPLAARLLRCRGLAAARALVRAAPQLADDVTARQIFTLVVATLQRDARKAGSGVVALQALAEFSRSPAVQAWWLRAAGTLAHWQGRTRLAIPRLQRAAALFRTARLPLDQGDVERSLVDLFARDGRDADARNAARAAARCYRRGGVEGGRRFADLAMNLGNLHHLRDRLSAALDAYRTAEHGYRREHDDLRGAIALYNQANIQVSLGQRDAARLALARARQVFARLGRTSLALHVDFAVAGIDALEGLLDRGVEGFRDASAGFHALGDARLEAHAALDLGDTYLRLNRADNATTAAAGAERFFRRASYKAERAQALAVLGGAALQSGRVALALRHFQRGVKLQRGLGNRPGAATLALGLAQAELARQRPQPAARCATQAARELERAGFGLRAARAWAIAGAAAERAGRIPAARRWAQRSARLALRGGDSRVEMAALLVLARLEERQSRPAQAFRLLRRAERLVERMRLGVTEEESRLAFALDKTEVYESLVRNRLSVGSPGAVRQALQFAERGKARLLAEKLASGAFPAIAPRRRSTRAILERLQSLERALSAAQARLADAPAATGFRGAGGGRVTALTRERSAALADLRRREPAFASLLGAAPVDPRDTQRGLLADELVLEYFIAHGEVHLFAVDRDSVTAFAGLAPEREIAELADRLRFLLGKGVLGEEHQASFGDFIGRACSQYLAALFTRLVAPVADRIAGRSLRIVPHGCLHGLPFHAFEADGLPLIERAIVSYAPSLATLALLDCGARSATTAPALVIGVSDDAAPAIVAEVDSVSRHLVGSAVLRGAEATHHAVMGAGADTAVLHVACHGFYAGEGGGAAGLKLGDAWLSLADVYALPHAAPLVVLSGCETGRGTVHAGDEWVSLVSGFMQAGARTVVAAQWELHDTSAVTLMDDFYRALSAGRTAGAAMADAQRRARRTFGSPLRWAPFAVIGDPFFRLPARMVA